MDIDAILKSKYPSDVVDALLKAFREVEHNFALRKWKVSELDAGHFVEAARRCVESSMFGAHTPLAAELPKFNDQEVRRYEQAPNADESLRILIPRALRTIYGIRNKRGVGHVGSVSPNEMDATLIVFTAKWVLAELVRLASGAPPDETQRAIDAIVERRLSVVWRTGSVTRVLDTAIKAREQILILLYQDESATEEHLRGCIEYANATRFRGIIDDLHKQRLIERAPDGTCRLSPKGVVEVEQLLMGGR